MKAQNQIVKNAERDFDLYFFYVVGTKVDCKGQFQTFPVELEITKTMAYEG